MFRRRGAAIALVLALGSSGIGVVLSSTAAGATTPGLLGGMDVAGYCYGLGFVGTTSVGPATLLTGSITGPNAAYGNWACVAGSGSTTTIGVGGSPPSFTNLCAVQYPGVASYAAPTDANNAYTWNCYILPPAAGPGLRAQDQAATSAVFGNDLIQNEIPVLKALVAQRKPLQALIAEAQFVRSAPVQELIADVLAAYQLSNQQGLVSLNLGFAIAQAVLA
jgi:hypothetical protein